MVSVKFSVVDNFAFCRIVRCVYRFWIGLKKKRNNVSHLFLIHCWFLNIQYQIVHVVWHSYQQYPTTIGSARKEGFKRQISGDLTFYHISYGSWRWLRMLTMMIWYQTACDKELPDFSLAQNSHIAFHLKTTIIIIWGWQLTSPAIVSHFRSSDHLMAWNSLIWVWHICSGYLKSFVG